MPQKWQISTHPNGRLVWIAVSDSPPPPPPPPGVLAPSFSDDALTKAPSTFGDAFSKGAAADECRNPSMADLLVEARSKLLEDGGVGGPPEDVGKVGLFCTGSGRGVAMSERAVRRAMALVGQEVEGTDNKKRKRLFGDGDHVEGEFSEADVAWRDRQFCNGDGVEIGWDVAMRGKDDLFPMFQTGSGRAVSLSKDSIKKARAILEGNVGVVNGAEQSPMFQTRSRQEVLVSGGSVQKANSVLDEVAMLNREDDHPMFETGFRRPNSVSKGSIRKARPVLEERCIGIQRIGHVGNADVASKPMFHTGLGRSVSVSKSSIDKARTILEGESIAKRGDVGGVDGAEQFPLFQTGTGRAVSVSVPSIHKASTMVEKNTRSVGNMEDYDRHDQHPMFQTGLGRPILLSEGSVERVKVVLEEGNAKNSGHRDIGIQAPIFQTGLGRPVSVRESSIQKARTVLEEDDVNRSGHGYTGDQTTTFQVESGRSVLMSNSLILKTKAVLQGGGVTIQGLGRSVLVSKSSIEKAKVVLEPRNILKELEEASAFPTGTGKFVSTNKSSSVKAGILLEQGSVAKKDYGGQLPTFPTGSGSSVLVCESSVQKARAVLEEDDDKDRDKVHNMGKKCPIFVSPLKTSSARKVNISSVGVSRAATLLGLEENTLSTQFFGHVGDKLGTKITVEQENTDHMLGVASRVYPLDGLSVHGIPGGCPRSSCPTKDQVLVDPHQPFELSKNPASDSGQHPIRFSTAGGKSIAISSDALQRAKGLLSESDLTVTRNDLADQSLISACKEKRPNATLATKENTLESLQISRAKSETESAKFSYQAMPNQKHTSSLGHDVSANPNLNEINADGVHTDRKYRPTSEFPKVPKSSCKDSLVTDSTVDSQEKTRRHRIPVGALVDITNYMNTSSVNMGRFANEKRRIGGRNCISPFKLPRSSRFIAPLSTQKPFSVGVSKLPPTQNGFCREKLSSRYPFQHQRKTYKEYFGGPPNFKILMDYVTDEVKHMDAKGAEKFQFQNSGIGAEGLQQMLLASGASLSHATKEWVSNHYKWIVWKLASLERCYPFKAAGKFLTVPNAFEELKYRYDREVNNGHRSAIKKILEGNAPPALMMVLCISAIHICPHINNYKVEDDRMNINEDSNDNNSSLATKSNVAANIELTDGWYSLDASLDMALSEQLRKRKLFVGQKLRIWGASLCGWAGPVSFHKASGSVKLMLHINGTYRARWNEPLGFCKHVGLPLAFKCIKASGGRVPRTLVGVTRIYPILYRERLHDGGSVVRSERMERKAQQLHRQRVSKIAEDILSEQQENCESTDDGEEGAKLCKMLERVAEPEVIMAGMTSEQLMCISSYQAKQKVIRQNEVAKKVEKALEDAALNSRDVTPFLKVRVVGLNSKGSAMKSNKDGLITIWNPTEKQKVDLVEGQIYSVTGLMPSSYCTELLYLQARGSSTIWKPLAAAQTTNFETFFTPRKAIKLSNLGEVPLASEFDIAGVILHVGDVYLCGNQKKQWLFLTDESKFISGQKSEEQQRDCLLAVSFSSPTTGDESSLFNYALSGKIVGFSNLVKRPKDQMKHIWVAEATDNATCTISHDITKKSHLREAAISAEEWALGSYSIIQQLKERVLCIIG